MKRWNTSCYACCQMISVERREIVDRMLVDTWIEGEGRCDREQPLPRPIFPLLALAGLGLRAPSSRAEARRHWASGRKNECRGRTASDGAYQAPKSGLLKHLR